LALNCSPEYEKEVKDTVNGERKVTERNVSTKYDKEVKGVLAEATQRSQPIVVVAETFKKVESSDNLLQSEKEVQVVVAETLECTEPVETKVYESEKVESSEDLLLSENVITDEEVKINDESKNHGCSGNIVTQLTEFETVVPFEDLVIGENVQIMNKKFSKCYATQSTQQKEDANETISFEPYQEVVKADTTVERLDRDLLFVYPFIGGVETEELAKKLKFDEKKIKLSSQEIHDLQSKNLFKKPVCISQKDLDCLKPNTYVNDNVISFWFRWIYRREEVGEGDSYVLDTYFYNWLTNDTIYGVNYCVTLHQNVEFVTKKFIYVPINESNHWSLLIIVNPGCIVKNLKCINNTNEEVPCLILLDSLKLANLHHKEEIARNIYAWLNALWRERYKYVGNIFDESTMPIFTPYVPQQNNSFDCGLFLCKYALAFKNLDKFELSYHSIKVRQEDNLRLLHVQKPFRFDNKNGAIANFRKKLLNLLEGLRDIKNSDTIDISDSTDGSISNDDHSGFGTITVLLT
jgi:hypothetical protein